MLVAVDLDGTISAAPVQMGAILRALRSAGCRVVVLTGVDDGSSSDQAGWDAKRAKLDAAGCPDCWDELVLIGAQEPALADAKAAWCAANGAAVLIDNDKGNARASTAAGVPLVLVPWATRT